MEGVLGEGEGQHRHPPRDLPHRHQRHPTEGQVPGGHVAHVVIVARTVGPDLVVEEARGKPQQQSEHDLDDGEDDQEELHPGVLSPRRGAAPRTPCRCPRTSTTSWNASSWRRSVLRRRGGHWPTSPLAASSQAPDPAGRRLVVAPADRAGPGGGARGGNVPERAQRELVADGRRPAVHFLGTTIVLVFVFRLLSDVEAPRRQPPPLSRRAEYATRRGS